MTERRAPLIAAGLLTAGFLTLWLLLPDRTFVFDGMLFSDVIERRGVDWRASLYNPRHLLFNPAFQALRDALSALGATVGAYRLVQIVNALAGAAGLWLFGGLLRRLAGDDAAAVLGAALLGASWTFGTRATEGQVYTLLAFGGLWTLWSAARLLEEPSAGRALDLAAAFSLTTLFHAAAACLAPAVAAALWLAFPARRSRMLPALAAGAALILAPYWLHFGGASRPPTSARPSGRLLGIGSGPGVSLHLFVPEGRRPEPEHGRGPGRASASIRRRPISGCASGICTSCWAGRPT